MQPLSLTNHLSLRVLISNVGKVKWKFYCILKKVAHILTEDILVVPSESTEQINGNKIVNSYKAVNSSELDSAAKVKANDLQLKKEISIWKDNDYLCKHQILDGLADNQYDYYSNCVTAKQVWETLQKKYDTEEAERKKYDVSRYLKYQMMNERLVEAQCHEHQKIAHEIITKKVCV